MKNEGLTRSQLLIMQCIWDYGGDISYLELLEAVRSRSDRAYHRSTLITFLQQLEEKGYIATYRTGRFAHVHPVLTEEEFRSQHAKEEVKNLYKGNAACFLAALYENRTMTKEDEEEIRRLLDELAN